MKIEIWSDIACPWCYVGKRRFEAALSQFEQRAEVEVLWKSYELDPEAPASYGVSNDELLARKYGVTVERAAEMNDHLTRVAALDGLTFQTASMKPGNTFDAHRLTHFAEAHGKRVEMTERLMKAYLEEGIAMSDRGELLRLATEIGLDEQKTASMLEGDAFADFVRADEARGYELGINGVPFFVVDERYGISGAQPTQVFLDALRTAWANGEPASSAAVSDEPEHCNNEGCAVHHG